MGDGAQCCGGGPVGEQSELVVYVRLSPYSGDLSAHEKCEIEIVSKDER